MRICSNARVGCREHAAVIGNHENAGEVRWVAVEVSPDRSAHNGTRLLLGSFLAYLDVKCLSAMRSSSPATRNAFAAMRRMHRATEAEVLPEGHPVGGVRPAKLYFIFRNEAELEMVYLQGLFPSSHLIGLESL